MREDRTRDYSSSRVRAWVGLIVGSPLSLLALRRGGAIATSVLVGFILGWILAFTHGRPAPAQRYALFFTILVGLGMCFYDVRLPWVMMFGLSNGLLGGAIATGNTALLDRKRRKDRISRERAE